MTCPYLKEVSMVFCRAYPVKKLVPIDHVTTESTCAGEFSDCPLYREARARAERSVEDVHEPKGNEGPKGATP